MRAKHTPGQWYVGGNEQVLIENIDLTRTEIALCDACDLPAYQRKANARLIAAAPNLLVACEAALKACSVKSVKKQLLAAITKAKGGA
jgi:hypothetical protein